MSIIDSSRRIKFEIVHVDSIPCSLVGQKLVYTLEGALVSEPLKMKWPMPWIECEFEKIAKSMEKISVKITKRVYNPDEPDQYVDVVISSFIDITIPQLADDVADFYSKCEALINHTGKRRIKYHDFKQLYTNLAKGLISIGLEKGNNVAVWAVNSPEFVISQFGIIKAGGIFIPMNAYEKQVRMEELLLNSDTHTLIMQVGAKATENIELLYKICPELSESIPGQLKCPRFPKLKNIIVISGVEYPGTFRWADILEQGEKLKTELLDERQSSLCVDDVAQIIYTSGSTGNSKGVMLSHGNIVENANAMASLMELTNKDVMCVLAPLFHCFGSIACTMAAVSRGCSMVLVNKFKTDITLSLIEKEKCTVLSGVPTLFISCIEQVQKEHYDISSLRTGIIAGASFSDQVLKDIKNILGIKNIIPSYGLTEASPCVSALKAGDEFHESSVGHPIPGVEVKIIDILTKKEVKDRESGEILVRGYNIMKGYYHMVEETQNIIDSEGWLHTGDIGFIHESGCLCLKGRCKDIIIRCGENISPKEIEDFIVTHKDVMEVHAVGVPDYLNGEEIMVFIRLKENSAITEKDIKDYCRGKIASNKIPKYISFIDKFPQSETGKVLKKDLKKIAAEIIEGKVNKRISKKIKE